MRPEFTIDLPRDVMSTITINATARITGRWRVRWGLWIMRLGAVVCGCGFVVTRDEAA